MPPAEWLRFVLQMHLCCELKLLLLLLRSLLLLLLLLLLLQPKSC